MKKLTMVLVVLAGTAACKAPPPPEVKPKFTLEQLSARFPADLGPDAVDVSGYPKEQQERYQVFSSACSQCHTLARPINAAQATREDWDSLVRRMHQKSLVYGWWTQFGKGDAVRILDFLAFDSKVRKLDRKEDFARKTAELEVLYKEVQAEKSRLQLEEGRRGARQAPDYMGDKPGGGR